MLQDRDRDCRIFRLEWSQDQDRGLKDYKTANSTTSQKLCLCRCLVHQGGANHDH